MKYYYDKNVEQEEKVCTKEYQRKLMTDSLRQDILKRDGFRCVICGRTANDGVKLHVDHIIPIAKGGKTVKENLRTLCEECNWGKRDKYDEDGVNQLKRAKDLMQNTIQCPVHSCYRQKIMTFLLNFLIMIAD